jgi:RNA polymerase sigma-70 factor (ECF subfamily)
MDGDAVSALPASDPPPRLAERARMRRRSETALVRGALAGVEEDLAELFRRHWRGAYRTAYFIVHDAAAAEDIAQEAFLSALAHLPGFDPRRRFAPWLGRIVANRAIDHTRARRARREAALENPGRSASSLAGTAGSRVVRLPAEPVTGMGTARPFSDDVVAALRELSPEHRAVVVLRYVLELTPGEIARALELPRGTVNSRLRRGLDALEGLLS